MNNKSNYQYLLSDLTALRCVGIKTRNLLRKKKLIIYLIYCGGFPNLIRIEAYQLKLKI